MWRLCRGAESRSAAEAAVAVAEPLGPSTELAWAYARLGGAGYGRRPDTTPRSGSRGARERWPVARRAEVLSYALNTEACAIADRGGDWTRRCAGRCRSRSPKACRTQAGRAYANMHAVYCRQRRFDEAERYFAEGIAYCDEHDIGTFSACLRGERAAALEKTGRWQESATLGAPLLADRRRLTGQPDRPARQASALSAAARDARLLGVPEQGGRREKVRGESHSTWCWRG